MAMTNQQQTEAYQFFAIAFGATPGVEYMNQLDEAYTFGLTTQQIVNIYTTKPAFTAQYPSFFSAEQFANALIANVVGNSASDAAKAEAKADILAALNGGMSRGDVIYNVFTNLANALTTPDVPEEGQWYQTALMLANKVEVARYATEVLLINEADQSILRNVTADPASVAAAKDVLLGTGGDPVLTFSLSVGQDGIDGNGSNNIFKANVVQNSLGQQVNTLGSGDVLDGGAGVDTLNAKITAGVYAGGGSSSMPIQPETTSVEIVNLQAVNSGISSNPEVKQIVSLNLREIISNIQNLPTSLDVATIREVVTQGAAISTEVYVNAKDMVGVTDIGSVHSDANLTIQNLTTQGLEKLSDMTIHMEYTGNADTRWNESDLHVYFDQDYLTPEATRTKPVVDFLAMNEDAYDRAKSLGLDPQSYALDGVFFRELQFTLNGAKFNLAQYLGEDPQGTGAEIRSYTEFLAAVQSALVQLKAANPTNAALQSVQASFGQTFKTDVDPVTLVQREGVGIRLTVDGLTNGTANTLSVASTDLEVARAANAIVPNNNRYEIADSTPPTAGEKLGINVALEKVGLAGDGGELVIGSMNKHEGNVWDAKTTTVDSTTSGIEEFYVTVYGNNTKSSSLSGLHSTNNNLRVVTVGTDAAQTGTYANLTIGNSNTDMSGFEGYENALKDVQTFNASAFKGDLTLYAALTNEVTAKYLNLVDAAPDAPGADNLNFEYTGGTGNDNINLTISADNGASSGAATREDFLMNSTINGGDGNDHITLAIVGEGSDNWFDSTDSQGLAIGRGGNAPGFANWYDNQKLNANLRIDGGNGNDTIWTPGSGDIIIDGGAGNDTVYADNTGDKAVWAFNYASGVSSRAQLSNLQSDVNDKYKVFKTDVKVSFLGFEATARIADVKGVASDLDINQAIKKAINSDAVLSKLLVATDGPANTLVVASRIDGTKVVTDLSVSLVAPLASALTAGELSQLSGWYSTPGLTDTAAKALIDAQVAIFNGNTGGVYNKGFALEGLVPSTAITGDSSIHTSDNHITGGLGNDVLVLGTGAYSNDTVVYKGFGNGTDSIVNFDVGTIVTTTSTVITTGRAESFDVTFSNLSATAANATVTFNGVVVQLNNTAGGLIPARDVALAFAQQYGAADGTTADWHISNYLPGTNVVSLVYAPGAATASTVGEVIPNVVPADFAYTNATGSVTVGNYVDGIDPFVAATPGTNEVFTVQFDSGAGTPETAVTSATTVTFDGTNVALVTGDGAVSAAAKIAAATFANWTAAVGTDGTSVVFTSKTVGNKTDATAADFQDGANGIDATVTVTDGTNATAATGGTYTVVNTSTVYTTGFDYIDFSAYNAKAVYVDGVLVAGTAPTAVGQTYITLVESATNDGSYTMTQYQEAGALGTAGDTVVGVIGVADFGVEKDFVALNFIL